MLETLISGVANEQPEKLPGRRSTKGRIFGPRVPLEGSANPRFGQCRPSRAATERPEYIAGKAPEGYIPCDKAEVWLSQVELAAAESSRRADCRENLMKVARALLTFRNGTLPTASPDWEQLPARAGVGRSTWNRARKWMLANNLLSHIAWGREEGFKPAYLKGKEGEEGNDRAVYGFLVPAPEPQPAPVATDVSGTITVNSRSELTHARAGASERAHIAFASLRLTTRGGSAALRRLLVNRKDPLPSRSETAKRLLSGRPSRESQALFAASVIRELPNPLARLSPQHLASILRQAKIFEADWTVNDVLYALSARPEDGEWRHSDQVKDPGGWVKFRLAAWSDPHGWPVKSKGQRERETQQRNAELAQLAAEQRRRDEELRARNRAVAAGVVEPGPGRKLWLQAKKALFGK